jgi:hypothetical protein
MVDEEVIALATLLESLTLDAVLMSKEISEGAPTVHVQLVSLEESPADSSTIFYDDVAEITALFSKMRSTASQSDTRSWRTPVSFVSQILSLRSARGSALNRASENRRV